MRCPKCGGVTIPRADEYGDYEGCANCGAHYLGSTHAPIYTDLSSGVPLTSFARGMWGVAGGRVSKYIDEGG